ncbi:hypothetical protein KGM48_00830 [Patescibacteria group bacterium]|nr:hypothetical protein [Patescibacteria group bacterium]
MSLVVPAVLPSTEREFDDTLALYGALPRITRIQVDVVDGRFATPASWPYTAPKDLRDRIAEGVMLPHLDRIEYEIDLMCLDAEHAAAQWLALGASRLTFHAESVSSIARFLGSMRKQFGHIVTFGLAVNVASDLALIEQSLGEIAYVQFMGIATIGRQGQPFDARVLEKIRAFRTRHPDLPIQVDGGVSFDSAKKLLALRVNNLVIGSGILRAGDPADAFAAYDALERA